MRTLPLLLFLGCAAAQVPGPLDAGFDAGVTGGPDAGLDAGIDAGTPPVELAARLAGWESRLRTFRVTSSVPGIASREVSVLTPPGYDEPANASRRYPVLVMHDGNNCLDRDPFGHGGWKVHTVSTDETLAGRMAPILVVMVDNTSSRTDEYVRGRGTAPGPTADGYLDFLEKDVVPWVDATWRTMPGPQGHGLGGSSYGGLISLDGAWRRRSTFGVVMAMSPAFGYDFPAYAQGQGRIPVRVYLDSGTIDWSGGDDGRARTEQLRDQLAGLGWTPGEDLHHVIGPNHNHSENFWRERLPAALAWLYPP